MMTRADIERDILRVLNAADGVPMPESALVRGVQALAVPEKPSIADVLDALKVVEGKYADCASVDLEERSWTLTTAGIHKARKI